MSEHPGAATEDIRVLIADDQPLMSGALRIMIDSTPGLTCVGVAADGVEAVEVCGATPTDVVLMDMQMPVMDGLTATRALRAIEGTARRTPVLLLTANALDEHVEAGRAAGADGHLSKPIRPDGLLSALARAAGSERSPQAAAAA